MVGGGDPVGADGLEGSLGLSPDCPGEGDFLRSSQVEVGGGLPGRKLVVNTKPPGCFCRGPWMRSGLCLWWRHVWAPGKMLCLGAEGQIGPGHAVGPVPRSEGPELCSRALATEPAPGTPVVC